MNPSSYAIRIRPIPTELKIQPVLTGYNILVAIANAELGNAFDALVKGFTADTPLENRAYTLVSTALFRACRHIYREDEGINQLVNASADKFFDKANRLEMSLRDLFEQEEYFLEADFFAAPHRQAFVSSARSCFRRWLESELGLNEARSGIICAGFPNVFFAEIVQLWLDKKNLFAPIEAHFKDNPFMEASYERAQRASYHAGLKSHYSSPPFGDPNLSLSDIYVEPDFSRVWHDRRRKTKEDEMLGEEPGFKDVKYEGGLHAYLLDWLRGKLASQPAVPAEKARFMLLLGQPGQGKSSFCYRAMYQLLEEEPELVLEVFFVKLKDILDNDLIKRPLEVIRRQIGKDYCNKKDQTLPTEKLQGALLLLDGLDELYMHKGMTNSDLHEFIDKLSREASEEKGLRVLVTARHHYLDLKKLSVERHLTLQLKAFSYKQQQQWLDKYAVVYPKCALVKAKKNLREIDKSGDYKVQELKNLYNQPILLHLMAKADFVPDLKANKATIYEFLFTAVIGRRNKDLKKYENLKSEHLREFLQVLAWHIFQSDFEYVRKIDFEQSQPLQRAADKIREKMGLAEGGQPDFLRELLVSFYFKNVHKDERDRLEKDREDYALEFYHKSLYEYLAAEHAVNLIKKHFLQKEGDEFAWGKRDGDKVLKTMCDFFAKKIFSVEVSRYFTEILRNDGPPYNGEAAGIWKPQLFERLRLFYPYLSARDFLADWHASNNTEMLRRPIEAALAVFYTYTIALGSLLPPVVLPPAPEEEHLKKIRQADTEKWRFIPTQSEERLHFTSMLIRLRRHHSQIPLSLVYQNLIEANLSGANLIGADLSGADLSGADLSGADLNGANFSEANFSEADLSGADLRWANLSGANLRRANLRRANLKGANPKGANLSWADLSWADLSWADLSGSDLTGADLSGAQLKETPLRLAPLRWINLSGANLSGSDLNGADLSGSDLSQADLSGSDLSGAFLSGANLSEANLSRTNLSQAFLNGANLSGANLSGTNLSGANLSGANLSQADLTGIKADEKTQWGGANLDNAIGWPLQKQ